MLEEALLQQSFVQDVAVSLVIFAEDMLAKLLDLADDVPVFVVIHILAYIFHNPSEQFAVLVERVDKFVNSFSLNLKVVKLNAQVGSKVELSCEVAQHTLEEGVDSLNAEVAVVVHDIVQGNARPFRHISLANVEIGFNLVDITL